MKEIKNVRKAIPYFNVMRIAKAMIIVATLCFISIAEAEPIRMVKLQGTSLNEEAHDAVVTSDGIVITGYVQRVGRGKDVLLKKFNEFGEVMWERAIGGSESGDEEGFSIIQTNNGDFVVTGYTESYSPVRNLLISRFDSNGGHLWTRVLWHPDGDMKLEGRDVIEDSEEDLVITGKAEGSLTSSVLLVKYQPSGTVVFKTAATSPNHWGNSLVEGPNGYVVVGKYYKMIFPAIEDPLLIEYGPNSLIQGARRYDDDDVGEAHSIIRTSDGGFAIVGEIDSGIFVLKLRSDLSREAAQKSSNSKALAVTEAPNMQNVPGLTVTGTVHDTHFFVARWGLDASFKWGKTYGLGSGQEIGRSIVHFDDGLWIAGSTDSPEWAIGGKDIMIVKTNLDGYLCPVEIGPFYIPTGWTPLEPSRPMLADPLTDVDSKEWDPSIQDISLGSEFVCIETPCCKYEPMGQCLMTYDIMECDDEGWMVSQCLGDASGNGIDDACEQITGLEVSRTEIRWDAHPMAEKYDGVYGDLIGLKSTRTFEGNVLGCFAEDYPGTSIPFSLDPPSPGECFWFLVRGVWEPFRHETVSMTYGSKKRDQEINADTNACGSD